ncbi:TPA: conjugative transfer protein MobI(A/C) [Vibrio parahaemolyticus]
MLDENSAAYRWHKMAQQRKPTEEKQAFELALSQSLNALAQVEHFTDQEPYLLEFLASCYANNFWRIHRYYKDTNPGHFACRVRNRDNAFEAAWHHNWYMSENQMAQRHNKKHRVRSTHIRKGKGFRYPPSRFSKANKEWESDLIDYTEDAFALVREIRHEILAIKKKAQICTDRLNKLHDHFQQMEKRND